ncbi:MAG: AMP-binding protein, partial [Deferrisomatales bacterium]
LLCDLGAQAAGAVSYGIYPSSPASEVEHLLRDGGAAVCVAQSQELVDRVLSRLDRLPALKAVVVLDAGALVAFDQPLLVAFDRVLERGAERLRSTGQGGVEALERLAGALDPEAPAFLAYSAGTTGPPRGVPATHRQNLAAAAAYLELYPVLARPGHRTVAHLPPGHPLGRHAAITVPLLSGVVPHFGESLEDLPQTLFEVAPTVLFTVPRYLERFAAQVLRGLADTSPVKRRVYEAAAAWGRRFAARRWAGDATALYRAGYRVAHAAALRPILNQLGFDQLELVVCGGAPQAPATGTLWQTWGVNLVEVYTQAETAGAPVAGQASPFPRPGDVGPPSRGWQVKLGPGGEVRVRGEAPEWLPTGDVGEWQGNALRLLGRAGEGLEAPGGGSLFPGAVENALRSSPYVAEAVITGGGPGGLTALVEIEYDAVAAWARGRSLAFTGYSGLARHPEVLDLVAGEAARATAALGLAEPLRSIRLLPEPLDPAGEGAPVTPTRQVKRGLLRDRYPPPPAAAP